MTIDDRGGGGGGKKANFEMTSFVKGPFRNLVRLQAWWSLWGMLLSLIKTKAMLISRSRKAYPEHPVISIDNIVLDNVRELKILGVIFDSKLTFETHVRTMVTSVAQKIGILRRAWAIYQDVDVVLRCF